MPPIQFRQLHDNHLLNAEQQTWRHKVFEYNLWWNQVLALPTLVDVYKFFGSCLPLCRRSNVESGNGMEITSDINANDDIEITSDINANDDIEITTGINANDDISSPEYGVTIIDSSNITDVVNDNCIYPDQFNSDIAGSTASSGGNDNESNAPDTASETDSDTSTYHPNMDDFEEEECIEYSTKYTGTSPKKQRVRNRTAIACQWNHLCSDTIPVSDIVSDLEIIFADKDMATCASLDHLPLFFEANSCDTVHFHEISATVADYFNNLISYDQFEVDITQVVYHFSRRIFATMYCSRFSSWYPWGCKFNCQIAFDLTDGRISHQQATRYLRSRRNDLPPDSPILQRMATSATDLRMLLKLITNSPRLHRVSIPPDFSVSNKKGSARFVTGYSPLNADITDMYQNHKFIPQLRQYSKHRHQQREQVFRDWLLCSEDDSNGILPQSSDSMGQKIPFWLNNSQFIPFENRNGIKTGVTNGIIISKECKDSHLAECKDDSNARYMFVLRCISFKLAVVDPVSAECFVFDKKDNDRIFTQMMHTLKHTACVRPYYQLFGITLEERSDDELYCDYTNGVPFETWDFSLDFIQNKYYYDSYHTTVQDETILCNDAPCCANQHDLFQAKTWSNFNDLADINHFLFEIIPKYYFDIVAAMISCNKPFLSIPANVHIHRLQVSLDDLHAHHETSGTPSLCALQTQFQDIYGCEPIIRALTYTKRSVMPIVRLFERDTLISQYCGQVVYQPRQQAALVYIFLDSAIFDRVYAKYAIKDKGASGMQNLFHTAHARRHTTLLNSASNTSWSPINYKNNTFYLLSRQICAHLEFKYQKRSFAQACGIEYDSSKDTCPESIFSILSIVDITKHDWSHATNNCLKHFVSLIIEEMLQSDGVRVILTMAFDDIIKPHQRSNTHRGSLAQTRMHHGSLSFRDLLVSSVGLIPIIFHFAPADDDFVLLIEALHKFVCLYARFQSPTCQTQFEKARIRALWIEIVTTLQTNQYLFKIVQPHNVVNKAEFSREVAAILRKHHLTNVASSEVSKMIINANKETNNNNEVNNKSQAVDLKRQGSNFMISQCSNQCKVIKSEHYGTATALLAIPAFSQITEMIEYDCHICGSIVMNNMNKYDAQNGLIKRLKNTSGEKNETLNLNIMDKLHDRQRLLGILSGSLFSNGFNLDRFDTQLILDNCDIGNNYLHNR